MAEIPFWIHDRPKWVSGISRHTTCQDILLSLVRAERKGKSKDESSGGEDLVAKEISRQLALVEQWRGVERPLGNSSKILKLWQAWGEERKEVKFVVKRISTSSTRQPPDPSVHPAAVTASSTGTIGRNRKPRRRTSRASSVASQCQNTASSNGAVTSGDSCYKKTDTVHPNALKKKSSGTKLKNHEIERLMRIILAQGETIHTQLKKLQEREGQIESIEQKVHDTRTRTAGKDYLLNAYLKYLPGEGPGDVSCSSDKSSFGDALEHIPDRLQEMLEALTKVYNLNEEIQKTEERIGDLKCQLDVSDQTKGGGNRHLENARSELKELRGLNDACGKEIDQNRQKIDSMREAFDARQAMVVRLEQDVGSAEQEGRHLEQQLRAIEDRRQQTIDLLQRMTLDRPDFDFDELDDDEEDEGPILYADSLFLRPETSVRGGPPSSSLNPPPASTLINTGHFLNDGHFRISNEELYSANPVSVTSSANTLLGKDPRMLYDQLQRRLQIKTTTSDLEELHLLATQQPGCTDVGRISATGSPGSASSSGNSSGSGGCGSEKSVRFSDRDLILSTPELPDLPMPRSLLRPKTVGGLENLTSSMASGSSGSNSAMAKSSSSLKSMSDPLGDTDSNSDTGLSSLHSSSDEGTYILDTLV